MERVVIIPALNPDEGLRELVERNWELENQVIIVNDGSGNWEANASFCITKKIWEKEQQ